MFRVKNNAVFVRREEYSSFSVSTKWGILVMARNLFRLQQWRTRTRQWARNSRRLEVLVSRVPRPRAKFVTLKSAFHGLFLVFQCPNLVAGGCSGRPTLLGGEHEVWRIWRVYDDKSEGSEWESRSLPSQSSPRATRLRHQKKRNTSPWIKAIFRVTSLGSSGRATLPRKWINWNCNYRSVRLPELPHTTRLDHQNTRNSP